MPLISLTKTYADGAVLTETNLDDLKDSIETALNTTKLDAVNIQDNTVSTTLIVDAAVTTAKLDASAVTTAKLTDASVTRAKLEPLGQQISLSCGNFTTSSTSAVPVTNLTVTITTTGRPVFLAMVSSLSFGASSYMGSGANDLANRVMFFRDVTEIGAYGASNIANAVSPSGPYTIDIVSAGTYVYTVQAQCTAGSTWQIVDYALIAFEM